MEKQLSRKEENGVLLKEGKDISELECIFTLEEIQAKVLELYPEMEKLDVNYHSEHILDNDWLKVTDDEDEFETVVKEQVEDLNQ